MAENNYDITAVALSNPDFALLCREFPQLSKHFLDNDTTTNPYFYPTGKKTSESRPLLTKIVSHVCGSQKNDGDRVTEWSKCVEIVCMIIIVYWRTNTALTAGNIAKYKREAQALANYDPSIADFFAGMVSASEFDRVYMTIVEHANDPVFTAIYQTKNAVGANGEIILPSALNPSEGFPWLKLGIAVAAGVGGYVLYKRYKGKGKRKNGKR